LRDSGGVLGAGVEDDEGRCSGGGSGSGGIGACGWIEGCCGGGCWVEGEGRRKVGWRVESQRGVDVGIGGRRDHVLVGEGERHVCDGEMDSRSSARNGRNEIARRTGTDPINALAFAGGVVVVW